MSNRLEQVLQFWFDDKDNHEWVLATIINTQGSSYRKSGAMMVLNSLGQYQGMLSGGCLEPDLLRQARRCLSDNKNLTITYDSSDDDDSAWQLGLGCGGIVTILLQPIHRQNQYLSLDKLLQNLKQKQACYYWQNTKSQLPDNGVSKATLLQAHKQQKLVEHYCKPCPVVTIIGGGIDARPVAEFCTQLGWQCNVIEHRVNFAQAKHFPHVSNLYKGELSKVADHAWFTHSDAIVIMTHNINKDALGLKLAQNTSAKYVGMLGPSHRTEKVFSAAKLTANQLTKPLSNPIGLNIGGDLPESIALSIMAEIHAVLEGKLCLSSTKESRHVSAF